MIVFKRNKKKLAIPSSVGNIDFIINGYTEEELEKKYEDGYRTGFVEGYERGTEALGVLHPYSLSFRDDTDIVDFKFGNIRFDKINTLNSLFTNCTNLESVDFTGVGNSGQTVDCNSMFQNTPNLRELDLSPLRGLVIRDFSNMFNRCGVRHLDLSMLTFNPSSPTIGTQFCRDCEMETLNISNCDFSGIRGDRNIFYNCRNLVDVFCDNTQFPDDNIGFFRRCGNISQESVLRIVNALPTATQPRIIYFYEAAYRNIPQSTIDLAAAKNFSFAQGG